MLAPSDAPRKPETPGPARDKGSDQDLRGRLGIASGRHRGLVGTVPRVHEKVGQGVEGVPGDDADAVGGSRRTQMRLASTDTPAWLWLG